MRPRVTIEPYAEGQHKVEGEFFVDLHGSVCAETLEPGVYELVAVCPDPTDPTPRPYKQPCPNCDGYAQIPDGNYDEEAGEQTWRACPTCVVCPDCDGTGKIGPEPNAMLSPVAGFLCPSCSVTVRGQRHGEKYAVYPVGQHDDHPERPDA